MASIIQAQTRCFCRDDAYQNARNPSIHAHQYSGNFANNRLTCCSPHRLTNTNTLDMRTSPEHDKRNADDGTHLLLTATPTDSPVRFLITAATYDAFAVWFIW